MQNSKCRKIHSRWNLHNLGNHNYFKGKETPDTMDTMHTLEPPGTLETNPGLRASP